MVGTSQGGFVGVRLALQRPDGVRSLVLAGSTALADTPYTRGTITTLLQRFPYMPAKLQLALEVCFGDGDSSSAASGAAAWAGVWKERYAGTAAREDRFRKCIRQFLMRDDVSARLGALGAATRVHILQVSAAIRAWVLTPWLTG